MFMLSYETDRKNRMRANNTQNIDYTVSVIIATMNLFDTKFLYFNSGICVLAHLHLVVPPGVNLTLVCKNSLRICEKK